MKSKVNTLHWTQCIVYCSTVESQCSAVLWSVTSACNMLATVQFSVVWDFGWWPSMEGEVWNVSDSMLLCHSAEKSAHSTLCSILCTFRVPDVFGLCIVCNLNLASTFAILCLARLWKEGTCIDRFPNPLILGRLSSQLGNLTSTCTTKHCMLNWPSMASTSASH